MRTPQGYVAASFEGAGFSIFRNFPKRSLYHDEIGDASGGMNAICSRPEAPDDVISVLASVVFEKI